ncbi:MAG: tripartite tricarboxylate transporter substrate binding protein [Pigmentiphaga sp.]|nr:tripartite tricarboxylate transporter substrate binding protein [Pigmentiphaga sp.]
MTTASLALRTLFAASAASMAAFAAAAQDFPSKPIQIIVPYAAGGSTDQLARALQSSMSTTLGQPVLVVNRPGAGGTIGTDQVARSEPDGYTLVFGNTGPNAIVSLTRDVPYDLLNDLQPISTVALTPMILAVPVGSPAKTLEEFIDYAQRPDVQLNYGSTGNGGISHLAGEHFKSLTGVKMEHIPYQGAAPMMPAFGGGQLDAAFLTGLDGTSMLNAGLIRYLAVATPEPTDVAPGLPAIADKVPGFETVAWFGLLAPKGIPDAVLQKLNAAVVKAVAEPDVQKMFKDRWIEARSSTPEELSERIRAEMTHWGKVAASAGIKK